MRREYYKELGSYALEASQSLLEKQTGLSKEQLLGIAVHRFVEADTLGEIIDINLSFPGETGALAGLEIYGKVIGQLAKNNIVNPHDSTILGLDAKKKPPSWRRKKDEEWKTKISFPGKFSINPLAREHIISQFTKDDIVTAHEKAAETYRTKINELSFDTDEFNPNRKFVDQAVAYSMELLYHEWSIEKLKQENELIFYILPTPTIEESEILAKKLLTQLNALSNGDKNLYQSLVFVTTVQATAAAGEDEFFKSCGKIFDELRLKMRRTPQKATEIFPNLENSNIGWKNVFIQDGWDNIFVRPDENVQKAVESFDTYFRRNQSKLIIQKGVILGEYGPGVEFETEQGVRVQTVKPTGEHGGLSYGSPTCVIEDTNGNVHFYIYSKTNDRDRKWKKIGIVEVGPELDIFDPLSARKITYKAPRTSSQKEIKWALNGEYSQASTSFVITSEGQKGAIIFFPTSDHYYYPVSIAQYEKHPSINNDGSYAYNTTPFKNLERI